MNGNFTISDLIAIGKGFCLFGLIAFIPGYVLGWLLDVLQFRRRGFLARVALSTPLSIAFCPIICYLTGRFLSMTAVWVVLGGLWIAFLLLLAFDRGKIRQFLAGPSSGAKVFLGVIALWIALGALSLVDIQVRDRLYFSVTTFDYCLRTAFTNAISTTGIPPRTPLFFDGHGTTIRYHYFWLILCSLVNQLGGNAVGPRNAMIAGTLWCGIGLMSLLVLYLRFFDPGGLLNLRRRSLIAIALLGVTGLDIIPTLLMLLAYLKRLLPIFAPSVEWWNERIDGSLIPVVLWAPHYPAGLMACLTGFLIVWHAADQNSWYKRLLAGVAAGVAFATAVGMAIYVVLVFAIFLVIWTLVTLAKGWHRETGVLVTAGVSSLALAFPFLRELATPGGGGAGGASLLTFTVRSFYPVQIVLRAFGWAWWKVAVFNGLFLPVNYFLELGFFFAIGYLQWTEFRRRREHLRRPELAAIAMLATSVIVPTFLRSSIIANNDLGARGFLLSQFILLLWGANYLASRPAARPGAGRGRRAFMTALLVLGAAGTVYDLTILRIYPMLTDAGVAPGLPWIGKDRLTGKRIYANRQAYEWLRRNTSNSAVEQPNPTTSESTFSLLYGNRQFLAADADCGVTFGGDPRTCASLVRPLHALFSAGSDAGQMEAVCQALPVDVLVVHDTDPVWSDKRSWVWSRKPVSANDFVRAFPCSEAGARTTRASVLPLH
jgi:hypothetical protein